jgi:ubiquinone/menaquinone biosynthesis C-methylase UbiE
VGKTGTVVDRLGLTGAERVLEVGPGPGFFSTELARRLPRGRLELFEVQPEMLDNSRHSLDGAGCHNVGFHAGDACDGLPFPDGAFDVAFLAAVLGEVPDKVACIRSLARVLRPGGLLVLVEAFPDPDRLSVPVLRRLVEPEGFDFEGCDGTACRDVGRFRRVPLP